MIKHGKTGTPIYCCWQDMKRRCLNKNSFNYADYGGRGISICKRWKDSFENFYADMGNPPKGYTIERINNDGNYEPLNCKWASQSEQNRNRRKAVSASKYFGVIKRFNRFRAYANINGKNTFLGSYSNEILCSDVVDLAKFLYLKDRRFRNKQISIKKEKKNE